MISGDFMANINTTISFGLVNIPVVYNPVIKNNDTTFNQLHKKCLHRIHYQKYCSHCKKIVKEADLLKGYEYSKNEYVTFTKEELNNLTIDYRETLEIVAFVPASEIDPFYYEKSYILTTPKKSKAFSLFLEALKKSKKVAIAKTTLHSKFYYCLLSYFAGNILMSTIYFAEEVHIPDAQTEVKFSKQEMDLALKLINQLSSHFKPETYQDDYQNQIKQAIDDKINGKAIPKRTVKKKASVKDLLTSLQKSLEPVK